MTTTMTAEPDHKLTYPIPHGEGNVFVYGKPDAPHLVFLCPGFPDDPSVFQALAQRISSGGNYLVGVTCLPGYAEDSAASRCKEGYSFDEWVNCLREAIKAFRAFSNDPKAKLTGIFHDWGCIAAHIYTNRAIEDGVESLIPDQLVLFDVLMGVHPKTKDKPRAVVSKWTKLYTSIALTSYQIVLAKTWFLQRYVSKYVALAYLSVSSAVLDLLRLTPSSAEDWKHLWPANRRRAFHILYMCYPYFKVFKAMIKGDLRSIFRDCHLPLDLQRTPVLFLYGAAKKFNLHNLRATTLLEREHEQGHRSRVVRVEGAGHWLYLQKEEECYERIQTFLEELSPPSRL